MRILTFAKRLFVSPADALGRPLPARKGAPGAGMNLAAMAVSWALILLLLSAVCWFVYTNTSYAWRWDKVWARREALLKGWRLTLWLSCVCLALSLLIGTAAALLWRSRFLPARYLARLYVEVVRGTPLLSQLLLGYFAIFNTLFRLNDAVISGILLLSLFSGAYIAEIIRGGLESVGTTQRESALAIGLSKWQTYRFVILPQTVRLVLPALAGQFANVIKDSSLLYVITVPELTAQVRNAAAATYNHLEFYLPLALAYLAMTLPISLFSRWLERRMRYET